MVFGVEHKQKCYQISKNIFNIIWDNKRVNVKRIVLCNDYMDGSHKMRNIGKFLAAICLSWSKY